MNNQQSNFERFLLGLHARVIEQKNGESSAEVEAAFGRWAKRLNTRHDDGRLSYGDESFALPIERLVREIEMESVDIPVWGSILHTKPIADTVRDRLLTIYARSFWIWRELEAIREEMRRSVSAQSR